MISVIFSLSICPAAELSQTLIITAVPKFNDRGDAVWLCVSDDSKSFEFLWSLSGVQTRVGSITLATNRTYTFTLRSDLTASRVVNVPYDFRKKAALMRIEESSQLLWDCEICEAHKIKMDKKDVPVVYGLLRPDKDTPTAEQDRHLFPHRQEFVAGGCVVGTEKTVETYVCHECKAAVERWRAAPKVAKVTSLPWSKIPWPQATRYDNDSRLRLVYLTAFRDGYIAALNDEHGIAVFKPETEDDKAKVLGYADGQLAGDAARTQSAQ